MKKYKIPTFLIFFGAILIFTQCGSKQSGDSSDHLEPSHEMSSENSHDQVDQADQDLDETNQGIGHIEDQTFQTLLTGYLDLNEAMVDSDAKAVQSIAGRLLMNLTRLDQNNNLAATIAEVKNIREAQEIAVQREHFRPLSEQFYQIVKTNQGHKIPLYKQYCPMAFDGKGAFWFSDNKEIENPYFGSQMLNCGTVQETLTVNG